MAETLKDLVLESHGTAKEKGWWDKGMRPLREMLMLMVTELAEGTEEVRNGKPAIYFKGPGGQDVAFNTQIALDQAITDPAWKSQNMKPEGESVELADVVIRIGDCVGALSAHYDVPLDDVLDVEPGIYAAVDFENMSPLEIHMMYVEHLAMLATENVDMLDLLRMMMGLVTRIEEYFTFKQWDFWGTVNLKMSYNKNRPYRHGGKLA